MDRIDVFDDGKERLAIILDYKSGKNKFKVSEMEEGRDLQIPVYLMALEKVFGLKAMGGFYYSIADCKKRGVYLADKASIISQSDSVNKKEDKFITEEFNRLIKKVEDYVKSYVISILIILN